ncbi:peptide/nickel transport system permease protein [Stella humosa]|uniref:Peptide/nickel transport system permease protein n=1 Tax=Stella humosa TaxID=94 RepID=A0A3N1KL45_9PROT|nr:ABC transporter permease [Stella humosa]ROP81124.1 peptide/nickel transport system permease protein [Stella humosa]BBK32469.1 ABC transporter permease [Stella humosa]
MLAALAGRLGAAALALLAVATATFLLVHMAPGGPLVALGGEHAAPGQVEELARRLGLDRPLWRVYLDWLGRLAQGDLGVSYRHQMPVAALIAERLPATLALVVPSILLSAAIGVALGLLALPGPGRPRRALAGWMAALHALPTYLVAQLLVLALARGLDLLPVQGIADARAPAGSWPGLALDWAHHLVLPVTALTLHHLTLVALLVRRRVADELPRAYVRTAQAKGASPLRVLLVHALPNGLLPLVALLGVRLGSVIVGAVVVETVFAIPGLGRLLVTAAVARDHPTVIGVALVAAAAIILANLATDLLHRRTDPRFEEVG